MVLRDERVGVQDPTGHLLIQATLILDTTHIAKKGGARRTEVEIDVKVHIEERLPSTRRRLLLPVALIVEWSSSLFMTRGTLLGLARMSITQLQKPAEKVACPRRRSLLASIDPSFNVC